MEQVEMVLDRKKNKRLVLTKYENGDIAIEWQKYRYVHRCHRGMLEDAIMIYYDANKNVVEVLSYYGDKYLHCVPQEEDE